MLTETLTAAVKLSESADADVTTTSKAYKEVMKNLSDSISACVGDGLLPVLMDIAVTARQLQEKMQKKFKEIEVLRLLRVVDTCVCARFWYLCRCMYLTYVILMHRRNNPFYLTL